jgi:hypothetical protein
MYNGHIYCEEYHDIKDTIIDIMNGDDTETDIEELADYIQEIYNDGKMPSTQYDELMGYIQDLL